MGRAGWSSFAATSSPERVSRAPWTGCRWPITSSIPWSPRARPPWRRFRTQPIDARDVTEMLAAAAVAEVGRRSLDIGGPDVLSYGEMIERIAELMLVYRPSVGLGVSLTPITARVAAAVAGERPELVLPLMGSLRADLLPADDHADELLGVKLHAFDAAVERALADWEASEPLAAR